MRRIRVALVSYAEESARALAESWDAFWFKPADPTLLGLIRILTGLMLLYTHAVWGLVLPDFFGEGGWLNERLVQDACSRTAITPTRSGGWSPTGGCGRPTGSRWPCWRCSPSGLWTRVTSILAFLVTVSYIYRVPAATFGLDQINAMLALYLAIGPSGAGAVDRPMAGGPPRAGSGRSARRGARGRTWRCG